MVVPDLAVAQALYVAFGLDVREEGNGLGLYTYGASQRWASLGEGARKKLSNLSFGVFEEDFEAIRTGIEAEGVTLMDPPRGCDSIGIWFMDPFGVLIELKLAEKSLPTSKSDFEVTSRPGGQMGSMQLSQAPQVRPKRLAHVLIFTPDVLGSIRLYSRVLGLRLSDQSGDGICFMHGIHGSDRHQIAFAND